MPNVQQLTKKLENISLEKLLILSRFIDFIDKKENLSVLTTELNNDEEFLFAIEKAGAFDFLNDPEEDIYTLEDGEPL